MTHTREPKYDIFISYRRKGGYDTAKHLYDLLTRDGYSVSFDIDTLRNGDFDVSLLQRIDSCTDFILIVDAHAFDRCLIPSFDRSRDWLRCELAHALQKRKNIIPILLADVEGFPENLPEDIAEVTRKNGPKHTIYYFDSFYRKLKEDFLESEPYNSRLNIEPFYDDEDSIWGINDWNRPTTKIGKILHNLFKEK